MKLNEYQYYIISSTNSECALAVDFSLLPLRRRREGGRRWFCVQIANTAYCSLHLPCNDGRSVSQVYDDYDDVLSKVAKCLRRWKQSAADCPAIDSIILGGDFNIGFAANMDGFSGPAIFRPEKYLEHRDRFGRVHSFAIEFGLRAISTFGDNGADAWTWATQGHKHKLILY